MAKRLLITGLVQGVGYRAWFDARARMLGLRGWVRNRRDGSVEAVVDGAEDALAELIESARSGPPLAHVDHVAVSDAGNTAVAGAGFEVRATE